MLLLGFALLIPRGSTPGSIAARNIVVPGSHIQRTPGYQVPPGRRGTMVRIGLGLGLMALGAVFLAVGL